MSKPTDPEVMAGVNAAIAAYAAALDTDRPDEIAALFVTDGVADIAGVGTFAGHDAIREGYVAFASTTPQLHLVANTVVSSSGDDEATSTSDLAFLRRGDAGWVVALVGRYDDILRRTDDGWRFQHRVTTFVP